MRTMPDLAGTHVLVTAAGSGIGRAIARQAAARSAVVTAVDREVEGLETLRAEFGNRVLPVLADLTAEAEVQAAAASASREFGPVHQLHNVVGGSRGSAPIVHMRVEDWDFTVALALRSCFLVTKHVAPLMSEGGGIVNVASINARVPHYPASAYSSAKAAVEMFTKCTALELRPKIRANAVLPGIVRTRSTAAQTAPGSAALKAFEEACALGRVADPADVAGPCLFLAGPEARHITGTSLVVDGGVEIMAYPDPRDYLSDAMDR